VIRLEEEEEAWIKEQVEGMDDEPGRIWRQRWRGAVKRGATTLRDKVCALTGLMCEKREV
jgi:hypothetical protein